MKAKERDAAMWHALGRVAGKEARREELGDGASYDVHLSVAGKIGRQTVARTIKGTLTVGQPTETSSSTGAPPGHVIALLLETMSERAREDWLTNLPELFAREKKLPDVPASILEAATKLLERLRVKTPATARGAVGCRYELSQE